MPRAPQQHLVDWLAAALVGALLLWASNLLVAPATVPFAGHGERFAAMVDHPLAFTGDFPQRVLWPLLAHVAGWFGLGPVGFSQLCSGALLTVVCWFARRRGLGWFDAVLLTAAVAGTGAVQVYKPITCMSDSLNLLLMVAMVAVAARRTWLWGLVVLASFSHETVFFFAPWLLWLRMRTGARLRGELPWLGAAVVVHVAWRMVVTAQGGGGSYGFWYYLTHNFWVPWLLPALWFLWLLVAFAEFGPLLVLLVWSARERRDVAIGTGLFVACVLVFMVLAYDVMRWVAFLVVPVVVAGSELLARGRGRAVFMGLALGAIGVHVWQHPSTALTGGSTFTHVGPSAFGRVAQLAGQGKVKEAEPMTLADAWWVTRESCAEHWFVVLVVVLATLATTVLGVLLVRYVGTASAAGSTPRTTPNASP